MPNKLLGAGLVALATLFVAAQPVMAQSRVVTIVNNSSYDIVDFFAANRDDGKWGGDFFYGSKYLSPGFEVDVDIDDGSGYCMFDFLAVFSDGVQARQNGVNACQVRTFYFND